MASKRRNIPSNIIAQAEDGVQAPKLYENKKRETTEIGAGVHFRRAPFAADHQPKGPLPLQLLSVIRRLEARRKQRPVCPSALLRAKPPDRRRDNRRQKQTSASRK
ncbi:hypothetical protein AAG570_009767 [Ranatra chinensis]|uniref:Uncharacterized protein n=1 Tax=Ranatra chinensis TaxID=642074 RepID=A0ABD0Z0U6_9HEMI